MTRIAAHPYVMMALNNAWANARLYHVLQELPAGAFTDARPGFFPSLCRTMNHIHEVDLFYIDALEDGGRGRTVYDRQDIADPEELAHQQSQADMRLAAFCRGLTEPVLAEKRRTERSSEVVDERVDALLLHLFQHQIHHRGQAHVQLSHAGVAPPQLDEFYLEYDRHPTAKAYHG